MAYDDGNMAFEEAPSMARDESMEAPDAPSAPSAGASDAKVKEDSFETNNQVSTIRVNAMH